MAELEELRVGVLQKLDRGLGSGGGVVDEGGIPSDHREVVRIVRNAGLENLLAFAVGERGHLSADNLGDLIAAGGEQFVGRGSAIDLAHVEDEVILLQEVSSAFLSGVGLDQRRRGALKLLAHDAQGELFEVGVGGPAAGEFDEGIPATGKRQGELKADDAVIVVLDLTGKALAGFEDQRLERFFDRRPLVSNIGWGLFEAGLGRARPKNVAEDVEAYLFADVELDQHQDGAAKRALSLGGWLDLSRRG